jgi:magnesium chelatase subunit D
MNHAETLYPFSALVGQPMMKRALVLAAIHPSLGGVLIRGSKGAAKSTAVRALAALMPEIDVYEEDPFRRAPGEEVPGWPLPASVNVVRRPVALVNLPVGATDDRVVGSLNLERALTTGQRRFEPGLLAAAHRGILYIDEVNLLADHLVDLLLDAAAMGVNRVEREGLAFRHPARFVLVGTMNPEEGDLRPQLLDRFGLVVEVEPMRDPTARAEVVRRRLAFETDPEKFRSHWAEADRVEGQRIVEAQRRLPMVRVPEAVLGALCALCAREGADGLRADLTIYKAATALAAYEGRAEVTMADVDAVAELALAHRRTPPPQGSPPSGPSGPRPPPPPSQGGEPEEKPASSVREMATPASPLDRGGLRAVRDSADCVENTPGENCLLPASEPVSLRQWTPDLSPRRDSSKSPGRNRTPTATDRHGITIYTKRPQGRPTDPALMATLRVAAPEQLRRGRTPGQNLVLQFSDLRVNVRARPIRHLVLFVVDASRSMGARERMRRTKGAVLSLLVDAYQKRDRVGLITFGQAGAQLVLPPTGSVRVAAARIEDLPIGGATPLAAGLNLARRIVASALRREPGLLPLVVLLSDGRGNLPIAPGGTPEWEALEQARQLRQAGISGLVVDTETGPVRLGLSRKLAEAWGADRRDLDELDGPRLPEAVRRALFTRTA